MRVNLKAQPSCWIINRIKSITGKKELQILDFASGSGRHSISLADPKRKITAVDNDSKKLSSYNNFLCSCRHIAAAPSSPRIQNRSN